MFSRAWFARHQRPLCAALNVPGLGGELRAALGVQRHGQIVALYPDASVAEVDRVLVGDFRTHAKHGKRLYHEFLPIWRMCHWFDQRVANPFIPALNLGFDTLTVYPDADPETTTVDGMVGRELVDELWSTIIAGAGVTANDTEAFGAGWRFDASSTLNQWKLLRRSIYLFNTSPIGASGTVTAAIMSLFMQDKGDPGSNTGTTDIYTSNPASNTSLTPPDFTTLGSTSQTGSPVTWAGINGAGYTDFTYNATGRGNINRTSISKFGCRNANYDVAAVAPTWGSLQVTYLNFYNADQTGTANDPKLVVTFTKPRPVIPVQTPHIGRRVRVTGY